jgi:hypothetical protein
MVEYRRKNPEKCKMAVDRAMAKKPEYYSQMQKVYWVRIREKIFREAIGHYSNGMFVCACCGETERDFLTIDYINGNGNKERLAVLGQLGAGWRFYKWLIKQGFPEGYAVLCMNCNMSKGKHGVCVHKTRSAQLL